MNLKDKINQLFKEIKVYNSQALYDLAKQKCVELAELVKGSDEFRQKNTLLDVISRKIGSIEEEARYFDGINKSTKMTNNEIDIVKRLVFASGEKDKQAAAWAVAEAFIVLRQFEKALAEFNQFIDNGYNTLSAAKNVLQCYIEMSDIDEAVNAYRKWSSSKMFSKEQFKCLKNYLKNGLDKENFEKIIKELENIEVDNCSIAQEEGVLMISSVKLSINGRSNEKSVVTLKVVNQNGDSINVIVPKQNSALIEYLEKDIEINEAEFHSSSIIFIDSCRITGKQLIESGENNGNYSVWITIIESDPSVSQ